MYDLYNAVSTICENLNSCSGVSTLSGASGRAKISATGTSDRGLNSLYWFWGVMLTEASATPSLVRRSTRYLVRVSIE